MREPAAPVSRTSRLRLGDLLLGARLVTREQLDEALAAQKSGGGRLGEMLVQLGYLAEVDLKRCLAQQLGLPFDGGAEPKVDLAVARLIPEQLAAKHRAVPVRADADQLLVALADPLNLEALDEIALQTGRQTRALVVTDGALQRMLLKVYGIPEEAQAGPGARVYNLDQPEDNTVVKLAHTILIQAVDGRASDIHIEPLEDRVRVRYRIDGSLTEASPLPLSVYAALISRFKIMAGLNIAERRVPQDGQIQIAHQGRRLDMRMGTVPTIHGERVAVRLLDRSAGPRSIDAIGMDSHSLAWFREMIDRPNGIILVTGPTGSGKSTTLMATLSYLNRPDHHIITIEDPVEYQVPGISQIQVNTRAGLTFATGLRSFLRQDPDIIMVGEIRDQETADIAVRAALTGHLVFSTLHTNDACGAIGRLVDMGVQPFLLASSLVGVVAQRLVRVLCSRCKEPYIVSEDDPARCLPGIPRGPLTLYRPRGCGFCDQTGFRGRRAIFEVLRVTGPLRDIITRQLPASAVEQQALSDGMRRLWDQGLTLVLEGSASVGEVQRVAFAGEV